jgi:hypothetical protein
MGRLASSSCGGLWGQTYSFDPFGNMNKSASSGSTPFNVTYNLKNQIAGVGGSFTPDYDVNGNLADDPVAGTRGVNAFDLEGKPTTLDFAEGPWRALTANRPARARIRASGSAKIVPEGAHADYGSAGRRVGCGGTRLHRHCGDIGASSPGLAGPD